MAQIKDEPKHFLSIVGSGGIERVELAEDFGKAILPMKKVLGRAVTRFDQKGETKEADWNELYRYYLADPTARYCFSIYDMLTYAYGYTFDLTKSMDAELEEGEKQFIHFLEKDWKDYVHLNKQLSIIEKQGMLFGNYFAEIIYDVGTYPEGWGIKGIKHLDPRTVYVDRSSKGKILAYYQHPAKDRMLPRSIKRSNRAIRLDPTQIIHIKFDDFLNKTYGHSLMVSILDTIDMKLGLKGDAVTIAQRYASPFLVWSVGSEDRIFPNAIIEAAKDLVESQLDGVNTDVFAPGFIKVEAIGQNNGQSGVTLIPLIEMLNVDIASGLGVPDIFIGGGGASQAADAKMEIFTRQVKARQQYMATELRNQLFAKMVFPPKVTTVSGKKRWTEQELTPKMYQKVPMMKHNVIESVSDMRLRIEALAKTGSVGVDELRRADGRRGTVPDEQLTPENRAKVAEIEIKKEQNEISKIQAKNPPSAGIPTRKTNKDTKKVN